MREVEYTFNVANEDPVHFTVRMDQKTGNNIRPDGAPTPEWTELDFHQCSNCPLAKQENPHCPVALVISDIIHPFEKWASFQDIEVTVKTRERTIISKTTAQKAISSLLGLEIAISGCPLTSFFKPMARFHLPVSSIEETVYRVAGEYLLAQYFLHKDGKNIDLDFEGLNDIYKNMHIMNTSIAERIRAASQTDSTLNALVILDLFSQDRKSVV